MKLILQMQIKVCLKSVENFQEKREDKIFILFVTSKYREINFSGTTICCDKVYCYQLIESVKNIMYIMYVHAL